MTKYRSYDGSKNNEKHPNWGKAGEPLRRMIPAAYDDGISTPSGKEGANPRDVSNIVCQIGEDADQHPTLSNYMWAWGQYLDHQLDLSPPAMPVERLKLKTPPNDPNLPNAEIPFLRSEYDRSIDPKSQRQQVNVNSSYMDSSNVYGSSCDRAVLLRRLDGSGKLKSTPSKDGDLLPFNTMGLENDQGPLRKDDPKKFFVAGDIRSNEHNVLTCMHTLFLREHNRLCDELAAKPDRQLKKEIAAVGSDEAIFQSARRIVGAIEQAITYEEFLPALLGSDALSTYSGYKKNVDATICNVFSTVVYRLGHDMLGSKMLIIPPKGKKSELELSDAFWKPERIKSIGIDGILNGLAKGHMEKMDGRAVEDVRTLLFNLYVPNSKKKQKKLLDLAALNIQRGRDHGIPYYNDCRVALKLKPKKKFEDISSDSETVERLREAYETVDRIDPWIGGLAEDHHKKAIVGEFFCKVLKDQFQRLRDGDSFWYAREEDSEFTKTEQGKIRKTSLADVIKRNTKITTLQRNVFYV